MPKLTELVAGLFAKREPLPAGMVTFQTPPEDEQQYRLHLRIEKDGTGLLIINAATVLHLNQSAVEFAYHLINQTETEAALKEISKRYRVDDKQIRRDYNDFMDRIQTIIETPGLDPVTYLDIERQEPYSVDISAPYRLDCAITYQVSDSSQPDLAPLERVDRELTTEEWGSIIQKAFDNGIPHIIFTGGEPTLREDLPDLILKAEQLGIVTGVLTDGIKIENDILRSKLLMNGLDHLMIVFDPKNPNMWDVLTKVLADEMHTTVHLTLKKGENLHNHLQRMADMGVTSISLSTTDRELTNQLQELRDFIAVLQMDLVWDLPVPYSQFNPVALELEEDLENQPPDGAGKAWLYIEPDGDVLPTQGQYTHILGNMLTDPWENIWGNR